MLVNFDSGLQHFQCYQTTVTERVFKKGGERHLDPNKRSFLHALGQLSSWIDLA